MEWEDVDAVDVDVEVDEVVDGPHFTLTQRGSKRDYYPFLVANSNSSNFCSLSVTH